jgi:ornithine cyclodeaminase/alanine dehydrogenase-like protein (mu-crystallin family)
MALIIDNDDVAKLLTIEETVETLEQSYRDLAIGEATCRPRIDIRIPTTPRRPINLAPWTADPHADISPSA